jgi:hypothetical protein
MDGMLEVLTGSQHKLDDTIQESPDNFSANNHLGPLPIMNANF